MISGNRFYTSESLWSYPWTPKRTSKSWSDPWFYLDPELNPRKPNKTWSWIDPSILNVDREDIKIQIFLFWSWNQSMNPKICSRRPNWSWIDSRANLITDSWFRIWIPDPVFSCLSFASTLALMIYDLWIPIFFFWLILTSSMNPIFDPGTGFHLELIPIWTPDPVYPSLILLLLHVWPMIHGSWFLFFFNDPDLFRESYIWSWIDSRSLLIRIWIPDPVYPSLLLLLFWSKTHGSRSHPWIVYLIQGLELILKLFQILIQWSGCELLILFSLCSNNLIIHGPDFTILKSIHESKNLIQGSDLILNWFQILIDPWSLLIPDPYWSQIPGSIFEFLIPIILLLFYSCSTDPPCSMPPKGPIWEVNTKSQYAKLELEWQMLSNYKNIAKILNATNQDNSEYMKKIFT